MILTRLFQKITPASNTPTDPFSVNAISYNTADVEVESLSPSKITTFYSNGHYAVIIDDSKYTAATYYYILWTYQMVSGKNQTFKEYFQSQGSPSLTDILAKCNAIKKDTSLIPACL